VAQQTTFWTDETYRIHGIDPNGIEPGSSEHIERSLECHDEKDGPVMLEAFQKCASEGKSYDMEFPFTTVLDKRIWIRSSSEG